MAEFAGLAYFAEIPIVIWDVTRVGPSTGLPTRTSQGDLMFAHYLGHGDTRQLCLLPGNMEECFEFGWRAFDLADEFQAPIFVLSDLDLGMNNWMSDPFAFPEQPFQRGKRLDNATFNEFVEAHGEWYRYRDYDEDGITYRTIPGTSNPHSAYLTRGTGHSDMATYSERSDDWLENMERLERKLNLSRQRLPQPVIDHKRARRVGIISHGSNDPAIQEARDLLAAEGIETNYLRVRALPLADSVIDFTLGHDRVYVVENNHAGQLLQIIRINIPEDTRHVVSLASGDTLPMTATWVVDRIREKERE
jgi:2-oxoglutarate ferredoxin oxidoreductase subunit alpha